MLPAGLLLTRSADATTCEIVGTPAALQAAADYTVTLTNVTGSSSVTVRIEVVSGLPVFVPPAPLVYTVGATVDGLVFASTNAHGGSVTSCVAATPLPDGLTIAALPAVGGASADGLMGGAMAGGGCVLRGTLLAPAVQAVYTIDARSAGGQTALMLDITVQPAVPIFAAPVQLVYAANAAIEELVFISASIYGGPVTSCVAATPLPDGLVIAALPSADLLAGGGCVLSGRPMAESGAGVAMVVDGFYRVDDSPLKWLGPISAGLYRSRLPSRSFACRYRAFYSPPRADHSALVTVSIQGAPSGLTFMAGSQTVTNTSTA